MKRGYIWQIPLVNKKRFILLRIFLLMQRLYFPNMICLIVLSGLLLWWIQSISVLYAVLFVEMFYFAVALHECIHITFAEFIGANPEYISFKPYSFGVRVHFNHKIKLSEKDMACILFSGPGVSLIIALILLYIYIHFNNIVLFICIFHFLTLNVLSLLPFKEGSDGYGVRKVTRGDIKFLYIIFSVTLLYILYTLGFKKVRKHVKVGEKNE